MNKTDNFNLLINRNKNINRGYRQLDVWQESILLFKEVRKLLKSNSDITFKVKGQIEDSALSVASNIAEGYSRRSIKENIQFISISLASLSENYSQIFALLNSEDISKEDFDKYDNMHYSIENKLIKMNSIYIQKLKSNDEWKKDYILKEIIEHYG